MYTAKFISKTENQGQIIVTVEFSNGTNSFKETVTPQDAKALKWWVRDRLNHFNAASEIDTTYSTGQVIDVSEEPAPAPTAAELAKEAWFVDFMKMQDIQKLIDMGVFAGNETKIVNLRNSLKTNFKPEYLNLI